MALEVTLGRHWGHFDSTLGPLGTHFWHLRAAVEDFGITLSLLWAHFWHMRMSLGSLWCRPTIMKLNFQKTLIFLMNLNDFWKVLYLCAITLRLLWCHIEATLGI